MRGFGCRYALCVLRATDALLAAKQLLAEIQRDGKVSQP
jgi:hypothetical protein